MAVMGRVRLSPVRPYSRDYLKSVWRPGMPAVPPAVTGVSLNARDWFDCDACDTGPVGAGRNGCR